MAIETYVALVPLLTALIWTLWVGIQRRDAVIVVNGLASIGATALPWAIQILVGGFFGGDVSFGPALPLWIGIAGVLHMLGMLGWYDALWWWDHVTHTMSAALVAAVVYAWVLVVGPDALPGPFAGIGAGGTTFALTMAAGVFWELLEWAARVLSDRVGVERVLKHYGRFDSPIDLLFDAVGAVVIITFDARLFVPVFEKIPDLTRQLLYGWITVLVVGSLVSAAIVAFGRRDS